MTKKETMNGNVKAIVEMEWKLFDQVQNIGGRADCQDNRTTFFIMRSSQLMAWNTAMLDSYYDDLLAAHQSGRNLLTEKYAYMMERTSPEEFAGICDALPPRSKQKDIEIDEICAAHVQWQEELAAQYPKLTGNGRPIRRSADSKYCTSFETYLWGELATYSEKTIQLYVSYVRRLQREGENLCKMILENTIFQYGYASLEQAEKRQ